MASVKLKNGKVVDVYCTTFCNMGHDLKTGKPVDHECYILNPLELAKEKLGLYGYEPKLLPARLHLGLRSREKKES